MPHTMALVCFLKRVVALAAQRQQTRVRAQHMNIDIDILKTKHTQARGGGGGARLGGNQGHGRSVTRQEVDDDTARQRKEINLHTLINPLQLIPPYSNTSLRGLSLEELHRRLTGSSIGISSSNGVNSFAFQ